MLISAKLAQYIKALAVGFTAVLEAIDGQASCLDKSLEVVSVKSRAMQSALPLKWSISLWVFRPVRNVLFYERSDKNFAFVSYRIFD